MLVSEFQYDLPPERIAQEPLADRAGSRLLHLHGVNPSHLPGGSWQDRSFREFPDLLRSDDLLVLNNTRVFPARLYGHRSGQRAQPLSPHNPAARDFLRGRIEVLLTRQVADNPHENEWECLVRPGRKIGIGEKLYFSCPPGDALEGDPPALEAEVTERGSFGERRIRFTPVADFFARVERIGHVPLPPYIDRDDLAADRDRYQTVYAQVPESMARSVAAPTAGLHFTPQILDRIRERGIEIAEITLHVGLGTFQPVRVEKVEDHKLHREWYEIPANAAHAINRAQAEKRRVVAIGTTTVRTLEHAARLSEERTGGDQVEAAQGEAETFIYPGYRFHIVNALLTNFHLPQSTLLMLVCALGGRDLVMGAYRHAVEAGYRFYSYGDCMFLD
jgi:S-adenosylmethionine:tRNA ribosyltransferase-isomerase